MEESIARNGNQGKILNELSRLCHSIAVEKGFGRRERNVGEALMLIVTELAEAMEAHRVQDQKISKKSSRIALSACWTCAAGLASYRRRDL